MYREIKSRAAAFLLLSVVAFHAPAIGQAPAATRSRAVRSEEFYRTELYFGRSVPDGGTVSDSDWDSFLAETVTPRFPEGFTILTARGQYRDRSGKISAEPSQLIIFLYPRKSKNESRAKIEEVRAAYIKRFHQESVLRLDLRKSVRVSF